MSKIGAANIELEEQAVELGFKDLFDATQNGYVVQCYENPITHENEFQLVPEVNKALQESHQAWLVRKETVLNELEMLKQDTPYAAHKEIIDDVIKFIKEGEVYWLTILKTIRNRHSLNISLTKYWSPALSRKIGTCAT